MKLLLSIIGLYIIFGRLRSLVGTADEVATDGHRDATNLERVSDEKLLRLIKQADFVIVLFCKCNHTRHNCSD